MRSNITYNHAHGETKIIFHKFIELYNKILNSYKSKIIIIDKNVYAHHSKNINQLSVPIFQFSAIERNKSYNTVLKILCFFYQHNLDRDALIIVVGGGLTCDVGAFATSIWKRGCSFMLVPTTLLAMVDAAIGGKTAINFKNKKNIIGTFYHPNFVVIDDYFLGTLPEKIYMQGIAEIIKHAVTLNESLFNQFLQTPNSLEKDFFNVIKQNIETKLKVVLDDPYEKNRRKILNFGHTIGHALEMVYKFPHGMAVAEGMLLEARILQRIGMWGNVDVINKLHFLLNKLLPMRKTLVINYEHLKQHILHDKKKNQSEITLTVVNEIGKASLVNIKITEFFKVLKEFSNNEIES